MFTPAASSLLSVQGIMNFSVGFLNGTQLYEMNKFEVCRNTVEDQWSEVSMEVASAFQNGQIYTGIQLIWKILNDTNVVAHSCYSGFKDIAVQYMNSDSNSRSLNKTLVNLAYNFGDVYDDLEAFFFFLVKTPYYNGATVEEAGSFLGDIVWWAMVAPVPVKNELQAQSPFLQVFQAITMRVIRLAGMKYA